MKPPQRHTNRMPYERLHPLDEQLPLHVPQPASPIFRFLDPVVQLCRCTPFPIHKPSAFIHQQHRLDTPTMATPPGDKKHLAPILEFLRFVVESDSSHATRFPKRINGVTDLTRETADSGVDSDSVSLPHELRYEVVETSSDDQSPSPSRDDAPVPASDRELRKRNRSDDDDVAEPLLGSNAPIDCELDVSATGKGCVTSKYFDFSLLDLGVAPMVSHAATEMTKELAKQVKGKRCCYITPGTSAVVTGDVIDVDLSSDALHVSPDRGMVAGLEWVHFKRVFQVPVNIAAVRQAAAARIQCIIEAARRGEETPRLSPVPLAVMPDEAPPQLPTLNEPQQ